MKFVITDPEPPVYGPPAPYACANGWASHVWTVYIEEGQLSLTTDCFLCREAVSELESEYFGGEFKARLIPHAERGGWETPETYAWFEIRPTPDAGQ